MSSFVPTVPTRSKMSRQPRRQRHAPRLAAQSTPADDLFAVAEAAGVVRDPQTTPSGSRRLLGQSLSRLAHTEDADTLRRVLAVCGHGLALTDRPVLDVLADALAAERHALPDISAHEHAAGHLRLVR